MAHAQTSFDPMRLTDTGDAQDKALLRQVVCFRVGAESYGVDIRLVREIRAWSPTTNLPNTPDYVRGVINIRGSIVPILDVRARFGQGQTDASKAHVVIVVAIGARLVGLLVDAVSDIVAVSETDVKAVPDVSGASAHECLEGIVTINEQMVALVAAERIALPVALN
ncbi:MAG: chemotaxis protein CheW [Dongiaceae bacterium]